MLTGQRALTSRGHELQAAEAATVVAAATARVAAAAITQGLRPVQVMNCGRQQKQHVSAYRQGKPATQFSGSAVVALPCLLAVGRA